MNRNLVPTVVITVLTITIVVASALICNLYFSTTGEIKIFNCEIYEDSDLKKELTYIDWGVVYAGQTIEKTAYLKNPTTVPANVTVEADNWSPAEAQQYLSFSWQPGDNVMVEPDTAVIITFVLSVSEVAVVMNFGFDIIITASG